MRDMIELFSRGKQQSWDRLKPDLRSEGKAPYHRPTALDDCPKVESPQIQDRLLLRSNKRPRGEALKAHQAKPLRQCRFAEIRLTEAPSVLI